MSEFPIGVSEIPEELAAQMKNSAGVLNDGYFLPRNDAISMNDNVKSALLPVEDTFGTSYNAFFCAISQSDKDTMTFEKSDAIYFVVLNTEDNRIFKMEL